MTAKTSTANHDLREMEERLQHTCPFCRAPAPKTQDEFDKNRMKRVEKNNPVAIREEGKNLYHKGKYESAFQYLERAVELGDVEAHFLLSVLYREGEGVKKDEKKQTYHLEVAAIGGHPDARNNLAINEAGGKDSREQ